MVKRHIYHFSRGMVIGLECLGTVIFLGILAWVALLYRLSQGPMDVNFLTQKIEAGLNSQQSGFEFDVGSTVLTWGGKTQPLEFEVDHVQISRADKTPVLSVEKIGIQLSKRYLVFGKFVPRIIKIYGPALKIIHAEDGQFVLNFNEAVATAAPQPTAEVVPAPDAAQQGDFMKALLAQMKGTGAFSLLAGLEQIVISNAAFVYEDKILNANWKTKDSDIIFSRGKGGLLIDVRANVEMAAEHLAYIRANFYYSWQAQKSSGVAYFTNLNPSLIAQQSTQLKDLAGVNLPLKGSIALELDDKFMPGRGRFVLGSDPGTFNAASLYKDPLPVKSLYTQGRFNLATKEARLEQLRIDMNGPRLDAKAAVTKQGDGRLIQVAALLQNMPMDDLKNYWPESLAADSRTWVTEHLTVGTAHKATLSLEMLAPQADFSALQLQKVGGQIDFTGIKVDYFAPLMPVTNVSGKANYDEKSFNLDLNGGALGDMRVTKSKINITGLDVQDEDTYSKIDIAVSLQGPLRTAMQVLDSEPLRYPQELGMQVADVAGDAVIDVGFRFPLYDGLTLPEVELSAYAKVNDVRLPAVVTGMDLSGGSVEVDAGKGALSVKGSGMLADMPVTFDWQKDFSEKAKFDTQVAANVVLNAAALAKFGVPEDFKMTGGLPAEIVYTTAQDKSSQLKFKGDVSAAGFMVPMVNFEKKAGIAGSLEMVLNFAKDGALQKISGLDMQAGDAVLKGDISFAADGKTIAMANLPQVKLGLTDVTVAAENKGKTGYVVTLTGKQLDASGLFNAEGQANSNEEAAKKVIPLTVSMAVDRLLTKGQDDVIDGVKMYLRRNEWSRIEQLDLDGMAGGQILSLHFVPVRQGHTLRFEALNAGAALRVLGITNGVRRGTLLVTGAPDPKGSARDMVGSVVLSDFSLVDVPILGRLLNAMSLTGIVELLNGDGIAFKKMRANFQWVDRGQPASMENMRLIRIKKGETSGASLGLTFEGVIDNWSNILDMNGTIIPVSDLNKVVGAIPVVGNILTGGGKGVFAATYVIKGPKADPEVKVNPLAVLAPGILRKLFFEK